jgi:drug/metabolite transporter (DMT)-like permease
VRRRRASIVCFVLGMLAVVVGAVVPTLLAVTAFVGDSTTTMVWMDQPCATGWAAVLLAGVALTVIGYVLALRNDAVADEARPSRPLG